MPMKRRLIHALAVAMLLLQVGCHRGSPVMPDKSRMGKADLVTAFLKSPADVDIVTGLAIDRIEAANLLQGPFVEDHVAAWNVFREPVGQHDMGGASRGNHDGRGGP